MNTYFYILLLTLMRKGNCFLRSSYLPVGRTVIVISTNRTAVGSQEGQGVKTIDSIV